MTHDPEDFQIEDLALLYEAARDLKAEGDSVGFQHLDEIIAALEGERGPGAPLPPPQLVDELLVAFNPEEALGNLWTRLDLETQRLLALGAHAREKLGEAPENARAVGVYVGVAFENEMRIRAESAYRRSVVRVHEMPRLRDISLWLQGRHIVSGQVDNMVNLRNRVMHPPATKFNGKYFNRMIHQAGLSADTTRGAFQQLAALKLPIR